MKRSSLPSRRHEMTKEKSSAEELGVGTRRPLADRLWAKVDKSGPVHVILGTPCWIYTGAKNWQGYGSIAMDFMGGLNGAHRAAWLVTNGAIPDGLVVMHKCDNRPCVNPDHLQLGTSKDNSQDASAKARYPNQHKTHCRNGHEYTPENTYASATTGWRQCRTCIRAAGQRHREQQPTPKSTSV